MAKAEIAFLLLLFAVMMPLMYASCPEDMCCPVGDDCNRNRNLCKPSVSKDCRKGNEVMH